MAEEVVSFCASGGHLSVTQLSLSLTSPASCARIHLPGPFHKRCRNYISKVAAAVRGVKRKRIRRGKASGKKEQVPGMKGDKWVLDKSFGQEREMQER